MIIWCVAHMNNGKESEMKQEMRVRRKGRVSSSITFIMIHFVCKQKSQFPSVYVCVCMCVFRFIFFPTTSIKQHLQHIYNNNNNQLYSKKHKQALELTNRIHLSSNPNILIPPIHFLHHPFQKLFTNPCRFNSCSTCM